ncbi:polysaccharide pyruvyl transferase family protein [Pseudomonas vancouverensis]|uniref:Polysaccharide pyruvyl transferase family protein n=1 Tax=Pseudomonas vancouverensis TaxID=95300 RepID=A0A1H2MPL3_PSEVA|nr:polysaccharide pyruvyl transferase family protein [Pseudomonas vancouverensis]KAB0494584.1 polysaccharide pyruvyl transferase family protein [Pseudomonas vancouverensis]TDB59250.1 polysaccharide pyruvyl transferase family protein [Pseudomonas vancouverensis]SDU95159.1 Polysaccharide pyruvyl transferase [Pseudomonas vancouverensis]
MKIAILTQPLGKNYGGIMQAWALQQVLKGMGYEPTTIDRRPTARSIAFKLTQIIYRHTMKAIGKRKGIFDSTRHMQHATRNMQNFIVQHIAMSEEMDNTIKIKKHFERHEYYAVIVGSDQTWRPSYSPNIYNYFLDFIPNSNIKRISYASSFGVDHWEYSKLETIKCQELAQKFDAISVREYSGINLCNLHLNTRAEAVLDPTLLLSPEDYARAFKLCDTSPKEEKLFTYILDATQKKKTAIKILEKTLGLAAYSSQPNSYFGSSESENIQDYTFPMVESWIQSIFDSEFVLTDSFHGCAFSIIFNKPFIVLGNIDRGLSRFTSLLDALDLGSRITSGTDADLIRLTNEKINWDSVNKKLDLLKLESLSFLKSNLSLKK